MGDECNCTVKLGRKTYAGKAHLDLEKLVFRSSEKRLTIPLAEIKSTTAQGGHLEIDSGAGVAVFALGPLAEKWAQKILHPKSLIDKLGVKPDSRVCVVNVSDENFWQALRQRVTEVSAKPAAGNYDLVFFGVANKHELKTLSSFLNCLKKTGAIWVIRPKGGELSDVEVITAAKSSGLVDVKVVRFSATHSAEKLMIPISAR